MPAHVILVDIRDEETAEVVIAAQDVYDELKEAFDDVRLKILRDGCDIGWDLGHE